MKIQELPADEISCGGFPLTNRPVCSSNNGLRPVRWALKHADLAELVARFGKLIKRVCETSPGDISGLPYTAICGAPATGWFAEECRKPNDFHHFATDPNRNPLELRFSPGMNAKPQWGITEPAEKVNQNKEVI